MIPIMKPRISSVRAVMARRILVNFRVDPEALRRVLPKPFRPKLVHGWGLGGICLIRLQEMRPSFLPAAFGLSSENAAHRFAVEWDDHGVPRSGVYIPCRHTNSLLNLWAGGRLFPGIHHLARFRCAEADGQFHVELRSNDHQTFVSVEARLAARWPGCSIFPSLAEASDFMKTGSCGWSPIPGGQVEAVELRTDEWEMQPLEVLRADSSFFADLKRSTKGSIEFDSGLLMRGIRHSWTAFGTRQVHSPGPKSTAFQAAPCC